MVMMYLAAVPFIGTLYLTEDSKNVKKADDDDNYDQTDDQNAIQSHDFDDSLEKQKVDTTQFRSTFSKFFVMFVNTHIFYLMLALFICSFVEDKLVTSNQDVNMWYILFEIISTYGNVGLSLGLPGKAYSLCGEFSTIGKMTIMFVMLLSKFRGMPFLTDAVLDFNFYKLRYDHRVVNDEKLIGLVDNSTNAIPKGLTSRINKLSYVSNPIINDEPDGLSMP